MSDNNISNTNQRPDKVFYISAVLIALFVLWGALSPSSLNSLASDALEWMITNFGWFYMLITAFFVLFVIVLAISPYGNIRLGKPEDRPEFSWMSWIGMLFAAGIGVGFVFFGVAEPLLYYLDTPVGIEPETQEAALAGLRYSSYHWALHPWAIFSIVGLTLAYVQFRKGRPALISSAFYPLLGRRTDGWIGQTIDILAVIATCAGVSTTFGLSAMQITGGLSYITPLPNNIWVQLIIIVFVTIAFMISASTGLDKGIKILSNTNIGVAGLLLIFVVVLGPTVFIVESFVTTLGGYISNLVPMSLTLTPFSESDWLGTNTIFFWAWHISWAPFMGLFIARISKGRTIRQFMTGVLLVPSVIAIIWFTAFGGTALDFEINGAGGLAELVTADVELALFAMLDALPFGMVTSIIAVLLILIFFITSADSATYVLGSMTSKGSLTPSMKIKLVWGLLIAGTASVLLVSGNGGLDALQTAAIIAALPFAIVMILLIISMLIMFKRDWKMYQRVTRTKQMDSVKEEFREEFLDDVKEEVHDEFAENVKDEMYDEVKDKVYDDMKEEIYDEMKEKVYENMKEEIFDEMKDEVYDTVKDEIYDNLKDEMKDDIIEELDNDKK